MSRGRNADGRFALVAGAAAVALFAGLASLPVEIRRVKVTGVVRMAAEEVARRAGVEPGASIGYAEARRIELALGRDAAFAGARVTRGITGTLHIHVTEREPAAWLLERRCAVGADGVVLPHFAVRDPAWPAVAGLDTRRGAVLESGAVAEVLALTRMLAARKMPAPGAWRRTAGSWEWEDDGRRVRLSSPPSADELDRLARFRAVFPDAWQAATRLDARFADRVVVSR